MSVPDIYQTLGITPIINAGGHMTIFGGSILSPEVRQAMDAANNAYTLMEDVFDATGKAIAEMLGTEGGLVTSGCYAALVQGSAAILTGNDPARIGQLPDTSGMKNEFLIQKPTRYHYDRCVSTPGGKLVEVGDVDRVTASQLRAAIGPQTAGVLFFARGERIPNTLPLDEVIAIAHEAGVSVLVDAAGEVYPLERMRSLATSGADLICFGGKYLGSGNSTGILCGQAEFVKAARLNGFVSYETENNRSVGRGYKIDRQEVIGTTVALRQWLDTDHEQRLQQQAERISFITQGLAHLPHVETQNIWEEEGGPWMRLRIRWDEKATGRSIDDVAAALQAGSPSIWGRTQPDGLYLAVHTLQEGETEIVLRRLQEELSSL